MGDDKSPAGGVQPNDPAKKTLIKKKLIKKSPVKNTASSASDSTDFEADCQCKKYISGSFSLACEKCDNYWHYNCVGLKGLSQEAGECLEEWLCPNCLRPPTASLSSTSAAVCDLIPVIQQTVEDAVRRAISNTGPSDTVKELFNNSVTKAVDKAVNSYAEVAAKSQKKVMEEMSMSQASKEVVQQVARQLDVDKVEREKRKRNVCINKVPESTKKNPRAREEEDFKFCTTELDIEARDINLCYRAGKIDTTTPGFCRPLIVTMHSVEDVKFYTRDGRGNRTNFVDKATGKNLWINKDLCHADRKANFQAREEAEKRKQEAAKRKKKDLKETEAKKAEIPPRNAV